MSDLAQRLTSTQTSLRQWLFDKALPIWWEVGGDREKGGFYEKINLDGTPCDVDRRTRVAARQVYSYALAKTMGYEGETDRPIDQGLAWLSGPARNPENGYLYAVLKPDGEVVKGEFDFYDHAFAMLAYASAFAVRKDPTLEAAGTAIRDAIVRDYSHPIRGFEESNPRTLPLKTNPHMHMFEACLAWLEAGGDDEWKRIAAMIADLCLDKFLHPETGSLREYFDGDWNPIEGEMGRIIEPGHQFEWGWLLLRWTKMTGDAKYAKAAHRLIAIAQDYGTDPVRNATVFELWDDFSVKDNKSRLWAQTERMKAYVKLADAATTPAECEAAIAGAVSGAEGLQLYFNADIEGLYSDRMRPDGTFETEPAPASTLYHIICAIDELATLSL
ncbi:mannose-6-phosphate isomerase [Asticcacaulis biprosthecium C19]|uniref:Mannose-6-phosphate isomerase n=1 Tax=Asticcacaulis biprosthecium C19 TaxID=715226 RepID=F4QM31_9CAUL|nr:AGE family epimerase/isomerase [Asticcacaulis biprosthecium]EGF93603.1 mannose-6-phosphate isomerase [Asticcacaulis biprosthecium C19]